MEEPRQSESRYARSKKGWALAFLSPKGGTGKTLLSATAVHLVTACDKRVVAVDADISTRGLSLFLIGRQMVDPATGIPTESCLTEAYLGGLPIEKLQPLEIVGEKAVYQVFVSTRELWKDGIPDRRLLGVDETPELEAFLKWWQTFLDRLREEFDFIILDTRGGYDFTTALAAVLADVRICVVEADRLSSFQLDDFLKNIERFGQRFQLPHRIDSFLINKAIPDLDTRAYSEYLRSIHGASTVGVVPADIEAIYAYQVSRLPLLQSPGGDFSHHSAEAVASLVRAAPSWAPADEERLGRLLKGIRSAWIGRRRMLALARMGAPCQLLLASLVLAGYVVYRSGSGASTLNWAYWALYAWALFSLVGASIAAFADHLRHRSLLARLGWAVVLGGLVVGAGGLLAYDLPRAIRPVRLLDQIRELEARTSIQSERLTLAETAVAESGAKRRLLERDVADKARQLKEAADNAALLATKTEARTAEWQRALRAQETQSAVELKGCEEARKQLESGKSDLERKFRVCEKEVKIFWGRQVAPIAAVYQIEVALNRLTVIRNKKHPGQWEFLVSLNEQAVNLVGPLKLDEDPHDYKVRYESGPRRVSSWPIVLRVDGSQPDGNGRAKGEAVIRERLSDRMEVTVQVRTPEHENAAEEEQDSFVFLFALKAAIKDK